MSTTVDARCNGDIVLKGDLRDAAASETAISLEVSSLASFFEEFFFDDEGGNDNDNDDLRIHVQDEDDNDNDDGIDDLRIKEYVEKGKLHRTSWIVKDVDGITTSRNVYAFSTTSTTSPGEGDAAAGIETRRRRAGNCNVPKDRTR